MRGAMPSYTGVLRWYIMTNGDYIRNMTDEELAEFLSDWVEPCRLCMYKENGTCDNCYQGRFLWVQSKQDEKYF